MAGTARITAQAVTLEPIAFGIFGGHYDGMLALTPSGEALSFRGKAALSNVDVAAAERVSGNPESVTGRLSGRIDLSARAADAATVARTAQGTARVDLVDGVVKGVVLVTSLRSDSLSQLTSGSKDEPFSRLGATLTIANGAISTDDLRFESKDLSLAAAGSAQLNGSAVDLKGKVQLSDALSQQAGRDLVRYTQEQGRVTLPATISGPAAAPSVRIDVADLAKRAIRNKACEEAGKAIQKRLERFLKK